ncbi:tRNA (guanine(10)-N2)-methyltransferase homolog isoform X2 [Hydractinia symbiolongicarpus]|uniref:tRNA (guanine(10)-N2)-methyltransferase homolog isoform X2 n=1 Tax=Hydractinia symbiolongicarpus TaxID=13093 RepID=UPI0025505DCB|nr:tRNA (guanine(10)-N2)-methyltransferase homolog isoform X2 [Hydractinia symbiolongicarpus]
MKYVCFYAQEFQDFRIQELESICGLFNIKLDINLHSYKVEKPYLLIDVKNLSDVEKILSRSILMKNISELWGHGKTFEDIASTSDWKTHSNDGTFKFEVDVFNKKITLSERVGYIEEIQKYISIPGEVDLKNPSIIFNMLLNFDNDQLDYIYFGKLVGYSQRNVIHQYNLKTRYFIGNTSMDPQLALLMANQAQVKDGSFCYDPFVGTGSIIIACSHFGGLSGGSDIDYNIIYGRGKSSRAGNKNFRARDEIIRTNYDHYKLMDKYWDIMAGDATNIPFRVKELFDAIVTDPPYGIREGGRKLGSKKDTTWDIPEDIRDEHIPAKKHHNLSNIITDLLHFAFNYLVLGGRLVYWLPVYKPSWTLEDFLFQIFCIGKMRVFCFPCGAHNAGLFQNSQNNLKFKSGMNIDSWTLSRSQ